MSKIELTFFHDPRLIDYRFSTSKADDEEIDETSSGYDEHGQEWRGINLSNLRKQGKIIKQFHQKTVFLHGKNETLLGDIRECPDGSWMAHSCYFDGAMEYIEVYGFSEEFHAISYLHEIMVRSFPNDTPSIKIDLQADRDPSFFSNKKVIYLKSLNAPIGYIQNSNDTSWMAYSFYHPKSLSQMKVFGFSSDFFAIRYLFQVAEVFLPECIQEVSNLSWSNINSAHPAVIKHGFDHL